MEARRGYHDLLLATMTPRRLFALSRQEWGLLLVSAVTVSFVRVALWVVPSRRILYVLQRHSATRPVEARATVPESAVIVWAVEQASRVVPHATCLTQALSARILLGHFGHPSHLCLGVARGERGEFRAHAWLEWQGRVLIGRGGRRNLTRLPDLPAAPSLRTSDGR